MKLLLFREKTFFATCSWPLWEGKEKKNPSWRKKKKKRRPFKISLIWRHLLWGYFQLWNDWQLWAAQVSCLSSCQSKEGARLQSLPGCVRRAASDYRGRPHLKTLASPSLPEGHEARSARQNPCEFPLYSKWHVPAAQCDTIRGWLCVNQMMTACWLRCPACCHSPPANPLPRESGNWFPDFQHPPHPPPPPPRGNAASLTL